MASENMGSPAESGKRQTCFTDDLIQTLTFILDYQLGTHTSLMILTLISKTNTVLPFSSEQRYMPGRKFPVNMSYIYVYM